MSEKKQLNLKLIKGGVEEPAPPPEKLKPMSYWGWAGLWIGSAVVWSALAYYFWMALAGR